jgi:ion channel-forming bestrophin family protein
MPKHELPTNSPFMNGDERWIVVLTLTKRLLPWFLGSTIYAFVVGEIIEHFPFAKIGWGGEVALANGVILGVLMGLRNRAAYDRWWEARRLWGQLVNDSRNLAWKVRSYVPTPAIAVARFPQLISGFAEALKDHLRGGVRLQQIPDFEHDTDQPKHVPQYLAGQVIGCIAQWQREELIDPRTMQVLDVHSRSLMDICGSCERIRNTPMAASYRTLLRLGLIMNVLLTPWYTLLDFGLWCIPIVMSFIFFAIGLEIVDTAVEEPFGTELDDLPLDRYCRTIRESVNEIFAQQPEVASATARNLPAAH